jgi:hypothetical protein
MTPADYVDEIVLPAMKDFQADRRSRRYTYQACMAVFHIKDHLGKAGEKDVHRRTRRRAGGSYFDVVRAITNGAKHVETDATHPIPFRAGNDVDRPPGIWGAAVADVSNWDDAVGGRQIVSVDLYEACRRTLTAFADEFPGQIGACDLSGL